MFAHSFRSAKASSEDPEDNVLSSSTENDDEGASRRHQEVDERLVLFSHKSTSSSPLTSPATSSSSPPSSSHRVSPIHLNSASDDLGSSTFAGIPSTTGVQVYNRPYPLHPFVHSMGHSAYTNLGSSSDTNEKFRKLKQKKEKRETRKEKNVLNSFNTGEEGNYSVDKVLKSLGELEKTVESKKNSNSGNNSSSINSNKATNGSCNSGTKMINGNGKIRRKSGDKAADVDDKKSTSDDEASTDVSSNYSSAAELNLPETLTAKNVVLIDEADLKRQSSRSFENLSSFTKVTKKQKRKKRFPEETQVQPLLSQVHPQRIVQPPKTGNRSPTLNGESERPSQVGRVAISPSVSIEIDDPDVSSGSKPSPSHSSAVAKNLDLVDFPPLLDAPAGSGSAPIWPIVRPSLPTTVSAAKTSDKNSAVMESSAQETPDLTKQVNSLPDLVASSALPDVACHVGPTCDQACPMSPPAESEAETESFFVDSDKETIINHLNSSDEINSRGNVETDSDENGGGFTFGFELNEELLSMSFPDADELKVMQEPENYHGSRNDHLQLHRPETQFQLIDQHQLYQRQQLATYELLHGHGHPGLGVEPQTFAPALTGVALDLEDNAIVCFGESFSDLNLADISSLQASDSGIEQVQDYVLEDETLTTARSNIAEIVSYVRQEWLKVQAEASANSPKVRYYTRRVAAV